jgi:branched-subunit amino acid transport protein
MTWFMIFGMTAITFLNRYAFFAEAVQYQPSLRVRKFLSFSTYAVLTAIWAPVLFSFDAVNGLQSAGLDYSLSASLAALMAFMRVRSILVVIVSTTVFFALRYSI